MSDHSAASAPSASSTTPAHLHAAISFATVSDADCEQLVALRIAAMQDSLQALGRFDPQRARERFLSGFVAAHNRHILHLGQRVGLVTVEPHSAHLLLAHLYIHPDCQRRGIGSAVLAQVCAEADALRLPLRVGALRGSGANRFYLRHGFHQVDEQAWDIYYLRPAASGG